MPSRSQRMRLAAPRLLLILAGVVAALTTVVLLGVAAVRWAHHVAALLEVAAIVFAGLVVLAILARRLLGGSVAGTTILELDLLKPLQEAPGARQVAGRGVLSVQEVVEAMERAGRDRRVVALFARIGGQTGGLGQIQELRDAVSAFRATGKPAVAFSETFGEFSPGTGSYYLATAFDEIALQPSGDLNLTGIVASATFVRGTLDKIGVVPRWDHRSEYKTAMNLLTETGFTPAHRESLEHVSRMQFNQIVRGIAERRGLLETEVADLIDRGPFLAVDAHEAGLVDRLAYRDQILAALKARFGANASALYLAQYAKRTRRRRRQGDRVALIMGVGGIRQGKSGGFNLLERGRPWAGSDTVAAAFRAAVNDKKVKAILFRVDSPGGSYVASDSIWRETVRAREAGKPVIVSMSTVAGSGGYFVAMAADKIVAQPGTITGSIGVIAGKGVTTGLRAKIGLTTDEVHTSSHATMWTDAVDYSPADWDKVEAFLDRAYEDFTAKVAAGRGLALDRVKEVSKGRIWTGEDAHRLGLVDQLGGYRTALGLVRQSIGLGPDAPVNLTMFPRPVSTLDRLRSNRAESSDDPAAVGGSSTTLAEDLAGPISGLAGIVTMTDAPMLSMPPLDFVF